MRRHITNELVDLVYLDPPFNSNQNYNVLFKEQDGKRSASQILAFEDTWTWDIEDRAVYDELITKPGKLSDLLQGFFKILGECNLMAYLVMMAPRLVELKRVMKSTASIYLHCDPTASHYLKLLMDAVFGAENFGNEIVWVRTNAKGLAFTRFARNHDIILRYSKAEHSFWKPSYTDHDPGYLKKFYRFIDDTGRMYRLADLTNPNKDRPNLTYEFLGITRVWRWTKERMLKAHEDGLIYQAKHGNVPALKRYLDEQEGTPVGDVWSDIKPVQAQAAERLGYPTQKPIALLERIINSSCPENGIVLDPFCGCGTTIAASQKLNRDWIGIDITHIAVTLMKNRLKDMFGIEPFSKNNPDGYNVIGEPTSLPDAQALADADKYQFQYWALGLVGARPEKADEKKVRIKALMEK